MKKILIQRGSTKVETKDPNMASILARDIFDDLLFEHPALEMTISDNGRSHSEYVTIQFAKSEERFKEANFTFSDKSVFKDRSGVRSQYDGEDLITIYTGVLLDKKR